MSGSSSDMPTATTATAAVTAAMRFLPSPSHVSRSKRPTCGPSSSNSSAGVLDTEAETGAFMSVVPQRDDGCGAQAELREDLRPVLQVAHEGPAPGLVVELVGHHHGVAGREGGGLQVVAAEEAAVVVGVHHRAVGAQHEHVRLLGRV